MQLDSTRPGNRTLHTLWQRIVRLLQSKTSKDTAWVLGGNLVARGLGLLSFMILTRVLGPQQYGIFSIAMAVLSMAVELSELGISASAIRYGAQYAAQQDWDSLSRLYSIVLRSRLVMSAVVFGVGILATEPLARMVFRKPELTPYLRLAFGGVFGTLLNSAFMAVLQANQQFDRTVLVSFVNGATSLGGVALLWVVGELTSISALVVYLLSPLVATATGCFLIPRHLFHLRLWDRDIARKLFDFGKWMALWAVAAIAMSRLGVFMLTSMAAVEDVGYFNAAYRIAALAQLVSVAYGTILTPKISSLKGVLLRREFRRSLIISLALGGSIIVGSFLAPWIISLMTGDEYAQSIPALRVLLWGMAFFTLNLPFSSTLFALEKPQVFAVRALFGVVLTTISNLLLIPSYGAVGASISFSLSQLFSVAVSASVVLIYFRKHSSLPERKLW